MEEGMNKQIKEEQNKVPNEERYTNVNERTNK